MKRADIKKVLEADPRAEFAVARWGRTQGIDAPSVYFVRIESAEPAARTTWNGYHRYTEQKPTGIEVIRVADGPGVAEKAGDREVIQPQDIVATKEAYDLRQAQVREYEKREQDRDQQENEAAYRVLDRFREATGFEARLVFHRHKAPGNRYSIEIDLGMAEGISTVMEGALNG